MKLPYFVSTTFCRTRLLIGGIILFSLYPHHPLPAQVVQDNTLPINSLVTPNGNSFRIDGGTKAGTNLFHSFSQFSLPTGSEAFFNNSLDIQNIISRVTGSSISNIDGVIRANGTANLFLINPNGIVFGPNASLNIGGSFLGSTASSINFADGTTFSAINPQAQPLLTVSVPVGLGFGSNPGAIRVQGTGHSLTFADQPGISPLVGAGDSLTGLRVLPGHTLALVGGDITLEGGILTAPQGRIELGSVSSGLVSLNQILSGWTLGYQGVTSFQDIHLSQQALADASGNGGGSIQVQGAHVVLTDGSAILIQNKDSLSPGSIQTGSISVNASESLAIIGTSPDELNPSHLIYQTVGSGNGGDITVSTRRLIIQDGGEITTASFGEKNSGNVNVNASESIQLTGASLNQSTLLSNITTTGFSGADVGNVTISTQQLYVRAGGAIASLTFGSGTGGKVEVNASESIEVIGAQPRSLSPSALSASTLGSGKAGDLIVNTSKLVIRDGGRVDASNFAGGSSGSLTINASEFVEVSGRFPNSVNSSAIIASANILDPKSRQAFGLPDQPSGNSGNVTINTPKLSVTDGAQVTVRNDGTGSAGESTLVPTLTVNANSIFLDNKGGITASTASGRGGNITLNVKDDLQLRHNSLISADAGGDQTGGNIIINAGVIAAIPAENSDITANAPQGTGGTITINTQGIFGLQVSPQLTSKSDITAFGKAAEFNGTVEINNPETNIGNSLNPPQSNMSNYEQLLAESCLVNRKAKQGTFFYTGTGGLPQNPYDSPSGQYAVSSPQALAAPTAPQTASPTPKPQAFTPKSWKLGDSIQEAQGMTVTADGRLIVGNNPQLNAIVDAQKLVCFESEKEG